MSGNVAVGTQYAPVTASAYGDMSPSVVFPSVTDPVVSSCGIHLRQAPSVA
jgi:hypothetical protein